MTTWVAIVVMVDDNNVVVGFANVDLNIDNEEKDEAR